MSSQRSTQADTNGALVPAIILFGGMTLLLIGLLASRPPVIPAPSTEVASSSAVTPVAAEMTEAAHAVAVALDPAKVRAGENSFQTTCSACHGFNAMGIPGLGKALIGSEFVNSQTDEQIVAFLQVGRAVTDPLNTTGVMMPARGGNPNFTDEKLYEIVDYLRSLNMAANQAASGIVPTAAPTSSGPVATSAPFTQLDLSALAVPTSASGGDTATSSSESTAEATEAVAASAENTVVPTEVSAAPTESAASVPTGESLYVQSCSGCHAADGSGVQYIAKPLAESTLLQAKDGIGLLNFLIDGDPALNPPHPYRGGYPELSDADLQSIIIYLYGLPTGN